MAKKLPVKSIMANGVAVVTLAQLLKLEGAELNAAFDTYLNDMAQRGKAMFEEIHALACFAISQAMFVNDQGEMVNNFVPMTKVVQAVSIMQGARHKSLVAWFEKHTPARWSETKTGDQFKLAGDNDYTLEAAQSSPYYAKQEKLDTPEFTLETMLKMIEGIAKKSEGKTVNSAQADHIKAIASRLGEIVPSIEQAILATKGETVTSADSEQSDDVEAPSEAIAA